MTANRTCYLCGQTPAPTPDLYVPTTEHIRDLFVERDMQGWAILGVGTEAEARAEALAAFDRWLATLTTDHTTAQRIGASDEHDHA